MYYKWFKFLLETNINFVCYLELIDNIGLIIKNITVHKRLNL